MGTTLKKLTLAFKNLHIEEIDGADILLKGVQSLVEHIDSPWTELVDGILPSPSVITGLLKTIHQKQLDFDPDPCVALAIQHAYLEVFQTTLKEEKGILEARFDLDDVNVDGQWRKKLLMSVEGLKECEIDATQINFLNFHNELLVKDHIERLTVAWLRARLFKKGHEEGEAINFARRISYRLYPQLLQLIAEHWEFYAPVTEQLKTIDSHELHELRDIGKYRASLIRLPLKPVFSETFALRDLYVELNATDLTQPSPSQGAFAGEQKKTGQLMQTVLDQLEDREHVVFIQAEPGKGKTTFCHMLAARVAIERPDWIPVFIRLRDEDFVLEGSLEESFKKYLQPHFSLTDDLLQNRRFLFILDGFDELGLSPDSNHSFKSFLEQISSFQRRCTGEKRWHHKIVITSRPMRIQEIETELPTNFLHLHIENMGNPHFVAWLSNWAKMFGEDTANEFRAFLDRRKVFEETEASAQNTMKKLASEPLLLYLLGTLHRNGALTQDTFTTSSPRRIEIYDRVVSWVCGDTRKYHAVHPGNRILEKSGMTPSELRQLLQEIALCVWHNGGEFAPITCITRRLNDAAPEQMKRLRASGFKGVHNLLISFSFQWHEGESGNVEFLHKVFGEYLTGEKMVESLRQIGECTSDQSVQPRELPTDTTEEVAHRFYSVFGVVLLTERIWDFVVAILAENCSNEEVKQITDQLYHLYIEYSNGRWMNEGITRARWDELKIYEVSVDLLRFEAQTGINLFVLLCLLYRQIEEIFEICGRENDGTLDSNRFRRLLALGEFVETFGLFRRIHHLLKKVNLRRANLLCANFRRANLQGTDLQGAILRDVNLRGAGLQDANLQGADLRVANLQDANLQRANLQDANMEEANLRDADLRGANLQGVNFLCADLRDADLQGANLQRAVLYGTNLHGTILEDANVTGTIISQQHLARYRDLFSENQIVQLDVVHD